MMEILEDFLKILIPAAIVLYGMFLIVKSFLAKDFDKKLAELKMKNTETVLPIRLQAYERMALFLERVSPGNLVVRLNDPELNASQFQQVLANEIRNEFSHNLSQQVYMSHTAWTFIRHAKDNILHMISEAGKEVDPSARSTELAKKILDKKMQEKEDPVEQALKFLKAEIQKVF